MTTIYFVRHAKPDFSNHNDRERPLTPQGLRDRRLVGDYLRDKGISAVWSSPYRRAVDTVALFAEETGLTVRPEEDFRERKVGEEWIEDFDDFARRQWTDFAYSLPGGESLAQVQQRNLRALHRVLDAHEGESVAVGSHGTALCTLIHYFDNRFAYRDFCAVQGLMPWIVRFVFSGRGCIGMEKINLFAPDPASNRG